MPLRPILLNDLNVRSHETGKQSDVEEALQLTADGTVRSNIEMKGLRDLNVTPDRSKSGKSWESCF